MRIGINALYLIPGRVGGSEIYLRNLLSALSAADRENEYLVFSNRESRGTFSLGANFREMVSPVRARFRPLRIVWEQLVLPLQARRQGLDLMHSPGFVAPLSLSCPSVVTVLDLIYLAFPETFPPVARLMMKFLVFQSARRSAAVIALSRYSRDEMLWELNIAPRRVRVVYLGAPGKAASDLPPPERDAILKKLGVCPPYVLSVAAAHPHKNLHRLLEAFYQLKVRKFPHRLMVMGVRHNRYYGQLRAAVSRLGLEDKVVFTGWVGEREKAAAYAGAELMVFPSLLEGFGLPVLEAMKVGLPVACSDVPSLAEVAGDAAYRFNPYSVEEIARAMEACLIEPSVRQDLIEKGRKQAAGFSWEKTARETLAVYREAAAGKIDHKDTKGTK